MKTKIYHLLVCIAGLLCLYACDDEKNNSEVVMLPRIMTVAPTDIKATSVLAGRTRNVRWRWKYNRKGSLLGYN